MSTDQKPERTEAQKEASRLNGAKSRGPITEAGKAISSQNARTHGLSARRVLLEDEELADFERIHAGFRESFAPVGLAEEETVRHLALYHFRLDRAISLAVVATDLETMRQDAVVTAEIENPDRDLVLARAVLERELRGEADAYYRYENHFSRLYNRTLRNLRAMQRDRLAREKQSTASTRPNPPQPQQTAPQEFYSINQLIEAGAIPSLYDGALRPRLIRPQIEPEPPPVTEDQNAA